MDLAAATPAAPGHRHIDTMLEGEYMQRPLNASWFTTPGEVIEEIEGRCATWSGRS